MLKHHNIDTKAWNLSKKIKDKQYKQKDLYESFKELYKILEYVEQNTLIMIGNHLLKDECIRHVYNLWDTYNFSLYYLQYVYSFLRIESEVKKWDKKMQIMAKFAEKNVLS